MIIDVISTLLIFIGSIFILVGGVGLLRMPDIFLRMSATTKVATLGTGLILLGTVIHFQDLLALSRAVTIFVFILATAPVSAHMLGRAAYADGVPMWEGTIVDELRDQYDENHKVLSSGEYGRPTHPENETAEA